VGPAGTTFAIMDLCFGQPVCACTLVASLLNTAISNLLLQRTKKHGNICASHKI
jgi:hypothetical protein